MLSFDALTARRALIDESADLTALRYRLIVRARPVIERMPPIPTVKALLSRDGGVCPEDGAQLEFDPWSPDAHRCPTCSRTFTGPRHHAHWARAQHLWIAERAAHLATIHALTDDAAAGFRARELLAAYYDRYFDLPNHDNVLGPTHLFFSTYLESIWILDYLAAAFILREVDALDEHDIERIDAIANEAATLIAEFNEGMSNRQTWHAAALTAIATWFGDEELAISSIEARTGLLGHLADGFGSDGMWYEGENYHLFALRGLMVGLQWAATAGADLLADDAVAAHLGQALMAPADTALPDLTFPARKDARYGVSLAHPSYIESWEAGLAMLDQRAPPMLPAWLHALYRVPPRRELTYDAYLHEAGQSLPVERTRSDLSWWALLTMAPLLPPADEPWVGASRLMEQQGLAIIRHDATYVSMECGGGGGGHGHPDRLHLTLHVGGVHWLPDPGTGSYTSRDLFWYRSTMAHDAPMLDGRDQPPGESARCSAYQPGEWAWCSGTWHDIRRSIVSGPRWLLDVVHLETRIAAQIDVPWHFNGSTEQRTTGDWHPVPLADEFVDGAERLSASGTGGVQLVARADAGTAQLAVWFDGTGELLRANGPGLPGSPARRPFYLRRSTGSDASMVTVLDPTGTVTGVEVAGNSVTVHEGDAVTTVLVTSERAVVTSGPLKVDLAGNQAQPLPPVTFVHEQPMVTVGQAPWVGTPPPLDGSLLGFDCTAPLMLDDEHQYFRSEDPYPGPDAFAAIAYVNWSDDNLYLAVDVTKSDVITPAPDAPTLNLDNEPEDINADGIQVYWRNPDQQGHAWLIRPGADGALLARPIGPVDGTVVTGSWVRTVTGYRITARIPCPHLAALRRTERLGFDLIVNEMRDGRLRRAGQLVWSGGPGWVYLRGDRHSPAAFGQLELVG